ncbi:hypothetical protein Enr10x_49040 [Gimesia panareensis]|uniref:Uncharacterized protein n=2 Tax=Gimesia panareensis TaxID=2527978 RepID=A0A517QD64_9PLAN|nr:hypothetical protein Enr10x_49040 [Gimesia panareensis]
MRSTMLRNGLTLLTLLLVSGLGSTVLGQIESGAITGSMSVEYEPEYSSLAGGYALSGGVLHSLFLEYSKSIKQGVSPGFMYVAQSSLRGRRFAFLCVVDHSYQGSEADEFRTEQQLRNSQGRISQWFLIKDVICRLKYEVDTHPQKKLTETMRFGIREVDLQQGRVFYIDLRKSPARVTQLSLQLPKSLGQEKDGELIKEAIQNWQVNGDLTHQGKSFLFEAGPVAARKPREEDLWPDDFDVEETE